MNDIIVIQTTTGCFLWTFALFSRQQGATQVRDDSFVIADLCAVHLSLIHWS